MSELKSAFITGAGGFIGRHLVHQLLQENVSVVALMMPNEPIPEQW
jgi:nucleoside-diphosphate-sugar epimerase